MTYDLLVLASDALSVTTYDHKCFEGLANSGKYGLSKADWDDLVNARPPRWAVDGTEMVFPAMDIYFANARRLTITPAQRAAYLAQGALSPKCLNGIFLADYCTRHGFSVEVLNRLDADYGNLKTMLASGPRTVAISTTFIPNRRRANEIARWIKSQDRSVQVILGGPLVRYSHMIHEQRPDLASVPVIDAVYYFQASDVEPEPVIDAMVVDARGEQTLVKILDCIRNGRDYRSLPNVAHYGGSDHRLMVYPRQPEVHDIEDWMIDWENLDERFLGPAIAVRGSIGCPLRCRFCSFVVLHPEWQLKGVDYLERELKAIASRRMIKTVSFVDDNLFLRRRDCDAYWRMMAAAKLPYQWNAFVRLDSISEENADWLAEANCGGIAVGVESGDMRVLENMQKQQNRDRILRSVQLVNQRGISTASSFIVGFPGETEETVGNSIKLLNEFEESGTGFNWFAVGVNFVIPLTPADVERNKWNLEGHLIDWEHETMNVGEAHRQVQRFYREVTRGAYVYYRNDAVAMRSGSKVDVTEALRLRHGLAVMDEYGDPRFRALTRGETLDRLERVFAGVSTSAGERSPSGAC